MMILCSLKQHGFGMRLVKRVFQMKVIERQLKIILLLVLIGAFQGCVSTKVVKPSDGKITIVPYSGVDSIQVGISTKRDVLQTFGKATTKCTWRPNSYPIALGEFVQIISYPELGITFLCDHTNGQRIARKTVREIANAESVNIRFIVFRFMFACGGLVNNFVQHILFRRLCQTLIIFISFC